MGANAWGAKRSFAINAARSTPPVTKKICAGRTIRVRRTVSACVSGAKRGNWSATSSSAQIHRPAVASADTTAMVPKPMASSRSAAASPRVSRMRV